jgi:hypothetical protein
MMKLLLLQLGGQVLSGLSSHGAAMLLQQQRRRKRSERGAPKQERGSGCSAHQGLSTLGDTLLKHVRRPIPPILPFQMIPAVQTPCLVLSALLVFLGFLAEASCRAGPASLISIAGRLRGSCSKSLDGKRMNENVNFCEDGIHLSHTFLKYSLRFHIKVTSGHKLRYEIKGIFGKISLKLR